MPSPRPLLLAFALALLLPACAKKKEDSSTTLDHTIPTENLEQAQRYASKAEVTCLGDVCHPSVGLLAYATAKGAGQCTASLVAPDIVATNGHCVPDDLKAAGADCGGRIYIAFAGRPGHSAERLECERVISAEEGDGNPSKPDFAFLRLKSRTSRPFLSLSRSGLPESRVALHKVDPARSPGRVFGFQKRVDCNVIQGSVIMDLASHDRSLTSQLADCEVMPGNSGGPILASDGSLRGVIFAILPAKRLETLFEEKKILGEKLVPLNAGTNFACLDLPAALAAPNPSADCAADLARAQSNKPGKFSAEDLAPFLKAKVLERSKTVGELAWFGWKVEVMGSSPQEGTYLRPQATCFEPTRLPRRPMAGFKFNRPIYSLGFSRDRYARLRPELKLELNSSLTVHSVADVALDEIEMETSEGRLNLKACW